MYVTLITSDLLSIPHGFSTRVGGVSEGPYESLNVGFEVGDEPNRVLENLSRISRAIDLAPAQLHTVSQVHGDVVIKVPVGPELPPGGSLGEADVLWTDRPGCAVAVRAADCVPILLSDSRGHRVAAVHSGWRGSLRQVAARAIEALVSESVSPKDLFAAVGPSIRRCCYGVSPSLAQTFSARFGSEVVEAKDDRTHLDLALVVRRTLECAGVPAEQIDVLPGCTACEPKRFFSHRRTQGVTGRHLALAVCR